MGGIVTSVKGPDRENTRQPTQGPATVQVMDTDITRWDPPQPSVLQVRRKLRGTTTKAPPGPTTRQWALQVTTKAKTVTNKEIATTARTQGLAAAQDKDKDTTQWVPLQPSVLQASARVVTKVEAKV